MKPLPCAPLHWPEFSALLDEGLALPAAARAAWLERTAPGHLRAGLARVLHAAADTAGAALEQPATEAPGDESDFAAGQAIGPWRLLRPLGRGGMGEVWLAERADGAYRREVALKLPHAFALLGQGRRRFARERDILAALQHPNIAQFLDAGLDGEQPWLALEHVDGGLRITDYCAAQRLDLRQRVALLLQALDAVQHAHGRLLMVHRDLKPSNLLVTPDGVVKLLDFGIAKLLGGGDAQDVDATRLALATPAYAAPEQLRGDGAAIGVAVDVYALGVLLHELTTGVLPRAERPASVAGAAQPWARQLRGDLDALIATALAPDPARRYGSVQALADELRRWLDGRPLQVRRAGWRERAHRYLRRHWLLLAAALAVSASLALGLAATAWQARQTAAQAQRAEASKRYLLDLIRTLDPRPAGAAQPEAAMRRLLRERLAELETRLPADPEAADELLDLSATLHVYLGDARRSAALNARRWAALKQRLGPRDARSTGAGLALAWAWEAAKEPAAFAAVLAELDGQLPPDEGLLRAEWWLAQAARLPEGDAPARGRALRQALTLYERDAPLDSGHLAALTQLGRLRLAQGDAAGALQALDRALDLRPRVRPAIALDHARLLSLRAAVLERLARGAEAAADRAQALALLRGSVGLDNALAKQLLAEQAAQ